MRETETPEFTRYHTFQREYELASRFMLQEDFINGVTARLISRTEPKWSHDVDALTAPPDWVRREIIEKGGFRETLDESFYLLESEKRTEKVEERSLFKYSLPMEGTVLAALMKGKMDGSRHGEARYTRKEFVEYMVGEKLGRAGAERKLNYILDMKTLEDNNGRVVWKFEDDSKKFWPKSFSR